MANPYGGEGSSMSLERELQRLHAESGAGYLAYGAAGDADLPRIDGTRWVYRDGPELAEEREMFGELARPEPQRGGSAPP
jgi:hypothetical protein